MFFDCYAANSCPSCLMKVPVFKACHVEEQSETSQRFFGTCVPQNDNKRGAQNDRALYGHVEEQGDETSQFNVTFVRTKVTKSRRDKRSSLASLTRCRRQDGDKADRPDSGLPGLIRAKSRTLIIVLFFMRQSA